MNYEWLKIQLKGFMGGVELGLNSPCLYCSIFYCLSEITRYLGFKIDTEYFFEHHCMAFIYQYIVLVLISAYLAGIIVYYEFLIKWSKTNRE